jgi:hypothetical protein
MAKAPTFFDYLNLRDELRGVEGVEERRAVISKHVLAAVRHFHTNHAEFPFDYDTPRARELWAGVEETAREVEHGEKTEAHLSGAFSAWKVTICEEYIERGRAEREAQSRLAAGAPAERPLAAERKEAAAGADAKNESVPATAAGPARRAPSRPKTPPPTPPESSPQGSLFG